MPTPSHNLRIPDEVWDPAVARAKREHENVTAVVVRALRAYVEGPPWRERALAAEQRAQAAEAELARLKEAQGER